MDFCENMSDIELGLRAGPRFCDECRNWLEKTGNHDLNRLARSLLEIPTLRSKDVIVSESIVLRGKRYRNDQQGFDFDVALSFAGADRQFAKDLAKELTSKRIRVFYDEFDQPQLWGKNLHSYLTELYRLRARFCVVFLSKHYSRSKWTRLELDAALAREFETGKEHILPIRLDESEVDGILPTKGYLDWNDNSVEAIADILAKKLALEA